jgi:transposase
MEVVHPRCCGIDVHKANACACISIKDGPVTEKYKQRFDTHSAQLRELAAWLHQHGVTKVAMEATGV